MAEADLALLSFSSGADLIAAADRIAEAFPDLSLVVFLTDGAGASWATELPSTLVGLVAPDATTEEIKATLLLASSGNAVLPLALKRAPKPPCAVKRPAGRIDSILTQREYEVLRELANGHSNKSIARRLQIAAHTVEIHVSAILRKLKVKNRTQAALMLGREEAASMEARQETVLSPSPRQPRLVWNAPLP